LHSEKLLLVKVGGNVIQTWEILRFLEGRKKMLVLEVGRKYHFEMEERFETH